MRLIKKISGRLTRLYAQSFDAKHYLRRLPAGSDRVCITFDDGPRPGVTEKILDVLARRDVRASFFLQGEKIEANMDLVQDAAMHGHDICNHGFVHGDARWMPFEDYVHGVIKTRDLIEQATGKPAAPFFRPPYGGLTPRTYHTLSRLGFRYVMWSVDSQDSFIRDQQALSTSLSQNLVRGGDIVLFHDDYEHTASILPLFLDHLLEIGLQPVSVSEALSDAH